MAANNPPIIERSDIHKSCKAFENIVNVFNDYCQVAETLALEQKKLARALKDAVGLKATNDLAGNALSAAASILEVLAEVDTRFVKVADKECEGASNELKKWFKKLAKDEKAHDERITAANAKIKQAGQTYEKKAKKGDRGAAEEHARYVNLLSVIGPEMSQDKYNHAVFVSQKHTLAVYGVASSVLRTADAEWTRACECVRRFAPVIGHLGEYRAFLEGSWMAGLPDVGKQTGPEYATTHMASTEESVGTVDTVDELGVRVLTSTSEKADKDQSLQRAMQALQTPPGSAGPATANSSASSSQMVPQPQADLSNRNRQTVLPPSSYYKAMAEKMNTDSVRSIESLSSFPTPPTHFPLPDMQKAPSALAQSTTASEAREMKPASSPDPAQSASQNAGQRRQTNAPFGLSTPALTDENGRSPPLGTAESLATSETQRIAEEDLAKETKTIKAVPQELDSSTPTPTSDGATQNRKVSGTIERSDSAFSSNSIVASLRNKWNRTEPAPSSPTKERGMPRVPNKVTELASRYRPTVDASIAPPLSPRTTGAYSPTLERSRRVSDAQMHRDANQSQQPQRPDEASNNRVSDSSVPVPSQSEMDIMRRRRRLEELEDLERREQAQALREREREVEQRAHELERERERLHALQSVSMSVRPTTSGAGAAAVRPHSHYSYSMTNLAAPRGGSVDMPQLQRPVSQHGEPVPMALAPSTSGSYSYSSSSSASNSAPAPPQQQPQPRPDHAPYCGCYACSASQYRNGGSGTQTQPAGQVQQSRPEKPKGWMRRLSMPVVSNAFSSSDSKKAFGGGTGIMGGRGFAPPDTTFPRFEQDSTGGISNVSRQRKLSFGRR